MCENNVQVIEYAIDPDITFKIDKPTHDIYARGYGGDSDQPVQTTEYHTLNFSIQMYYKGEPCAFMITKYSQALMNLVGKFGYGQIGTWTLDEAMAVWGEDVNQCKDWKWVK